LLNRQITEQTIIILLNGASEKNKFAFLVTNKLENKHKLC
jgi:hypothetical protein